MNAVFVSMSGLNAAASRFERASETLNTSFQTGSDADPVSAIVAQKQAAFEFKANVATFRAASDMSKALLNILA